MPLCCYHAADAIMLMLITLMRASAAERGALYASDKDGSDKILRRYKIRLRAIFCQDVTLLPRRAPMLMPCRRDDAAMLC